MTVHMRHEHHPDGDVAVIDGVDTPAALAHLCHSLISGSGIKDQVVVIDLAGAPAVAAQSDALVTEAMIALCRRRRWLGLVDPQRIEASGGMTGQVYRTERDAVAAGRQYLKLMSGDRQPSAGLIAAGRAVVGGASQLPGAAAVGLAWAARVARQRVTGPLRNKR